MAEYKTFEITFTTILENGEAKAKVYMKDNETEFKDEIEYKLDINEIDKLGGNYLDNVSEFLLDKAIDQLIEQKKDFRKTIQNVYDEN